MPPTVTDMKRATRAAALDARRDLPEAVRDAANGAISRRLLSLPELDGARRVLLYAATDHEVDLSAAGTALRARGVQTLYPRVAGTDLEVVDVTAPEAFRPGYRGLDEPSGPARDPASIDVVVLPGVAFDRHGGRLGWGKGFYDRFLPTIPDGALRIGACFAVQMAPDIPCEPHDEPVHMIVTENAVIRPPARRRDPGVPASRRLS